MLKEKNFYKNDLPINVLTVNLEEYPIHFHDDLEVVYVLDGSVKLKNGYYTYTLKKGDIYILNDREIHSFTRDEGNNMVMMLQIDLSYFSRYYENLRNCFFVTDMDDDDESLDVLRSLLAKIMMEMLQKGYGYEHKIIETTHNLLSCLINDFQYFVMEDGRFVNEVKNKGNKILAGRLNRITDYMYENYNRKLTLKEIADREHLSIYYLSHVIKEATGLSFQDLLSFIRVEESEKLLLGTNKKIGVIAEETGFSAVRYYIKHFETWFGMHPDRYRAEYTGKVFGREVEARYERSTPEAIEDAIRLQSKGVYSDYVTSKNVKPIITDIDFEEKPQVRESDFVMLEEYLESANIKFERKPYDLLKRMGGTVYAKGDNYIVTADVSRDGTVNCMSILAYNFNRNLVRLMCEASGNNARLHGIDSFNEQMELLIRCTGINGSYDVSRYKLTRDCIMAAYESVYTAATQSGNERDIILTNWHTLPMVEFGSAQVADTMNLRVALDGYSAELIMVDRKKK